MTGQRGGGAEGSQLSRRVDFVPLTLGTLQRTIASGESTELFIFFLHHKLS